MTVMPLPPKPTLQTFVPKPVDKRHMLWETFGDDIRAEWLGTGLRNLQIPFDYEPVTVADDTFRDPNVGTKIEALPRKATGRWRFYVQPEDADRAKELLAKVLAG